MKSTMPQTAAHAMSKDTALRFVSAIEIGLDSAEAANRLAEHGPNRLPEQARRSTMRRFLSHFNNVLI